MSVIERGKLIKCDAEDCTAQAAVPIALQPVTLASGGDRTPAGWLFILRNGAARHYCPICAHGYLRARRQSQSERAET
ncbi:MAG TPA: hypothetical protein VKT77_04720 [Chthonomonadaceae bacterium]|nr:hypothetical protein [Chthonomonadaceae bacterium]